MRFIRILGLLVIFIAGLMCGHELGERRGREDGYKEACQDAQTGKLKMIAITKWEWKNAADKR